MWCDRHSSTRAPKRQAEPETGPLEAETTKKQKFSPVTRAHDEPTVCGVLKALGPVSEQESLSPMLRDDLLRLRKLLTSQAKHWPPHITQTYKNNVDHQLQVLDYVLRHVPVRSKGVL